MFHFASVPTSELALPSLPVSLQKTASSLIPAFYRFSQLHMEHTQHEYQDGLPSHINPEFLQACPEAETMSSCLQPPVCIYFLPRYALSSYQSVLSYMSMLNKSSTGSASITSSPATSPAHQICASLLKKRLPSSGSAATSYRLTSIHLARNTLSDVKHKFTEQASRWATYEQEAAIFFCM